MNVDWDSESVFGLGLCIPTYDLPPTQTLDSKVALTATPGMLTIWHVLEAMSRDLHVSTCLASFRSEDELFYIIFICFSEETKHGIDYWLFHKGLISLLESWEFKADRRKNFPVVWWQINRISKEINQSENIFFFHGR